MLNEHMQVANKKVHGLLQRATVLASVSHELSAATTVAEAAKATKATKGVAAAADLLPSPVVLPKKAALQEDRRRPVVEALLLLLPLVLLPLALLILPVLLLPA